LNRSNYFSISWEKFPGLFRNTSDCGSAKSDFLEVISQMKDIIHEMESLFVYGTLLSAFNIPMHNKIRPFMEFRGWGTVQGILADLGPYPGLIISDDPGDRVHGEIYRIRDAFSLFALLDPFEGIDDIIFGPHEYKRRLRPVCMINGLELNAWVYLYNRDPKGYHVIESGSYLRARKHS
jgi:gamma-glutamylcyclotransferase (GGCT)/AIG2-like uncharacterized protein YtfP